jgi:hypothetical protein
MTICNSLGNKFGTIAAAGAPALAIFTHKSRALGVGEVEKELSGLAASFSGASTTTF